MISEIGAASAICVWCWFGFEVVSSLSGRFLGPVAIAAVGVPVGVMSFAWAVFALNVRFPLCPSLGWFATSLFFFAASLLAAFSGRHRKAKKLKHEIPLKFLFLFTTLPSLFIFSLLYVCILDDGVMCRGATYGDLPFHLNIITSFVHGCNARRNYLFDIATPFFANTKLAYPVLVNFLSSAMMGCFGLSLRQSVLFPSFPIVFALIAILNQIIYHFTNSNAACGMGVWMFMFLGGNGFFYFMNDKNRQNYNADFVHNLGGERTAYWLHCLFHVLIPQRLSLFGMPVSFAYLLVLVKADFSSISPYVLAGLLIGLMPQIQAHACIAAFEYTLVYALLHFPWRDKRKWFSQIKCYLSLGIPALCLAIPQLVPFMGRANTKGFVSLKPIWKGDDEYSSFVSLWWESLFIFWAIAIFFGPWILSKKQLLEYLPSLFVFAVSNMMHYQPWNVDNSKVFYAGWVPFAVAVVANYFAFLLDRDNDVLEGIVYILLLSCSCSGIISVFRTYNASAFQWETNYAPMEFVQDIMQATDPKGVFVSDSFHNNPISNLAGRQVLVGYKGWLISHYLDHSERDMRVSSLLSSSCDTQWMDQNNVSYFVYNKNRHDEIIHDIGNSRCWSLIIDNDFWSVYQRLL